MDAKTRNELIAQHRRAIEELEATEAEVPAERGWPPKGPYWLWHVLVGLMLGSLASMVSLVANVVGAPWFGRRPLELIRVYLTFPMGSRALEQEEGVVLFIGCLLYLITGALYGVLFHFLMTFVFPQVLGWKRFLLASGLGLGLWIVNFYLLLSWLQPLLQGDNWILRLVPPWVAAATHLAFVWTLLAGESWGRFESWAPGRKVVGEVS